MRSETTGYQAVRLQWVTQPRLFIRAYYVRKAGDVTEYPFSRDFSTGEVVSAATPKLELVKTVSGAAQQVDPIAGRSSIGFFEVQLGDDATRSIARQLADPALPMLTTAITATPKPTVRAASHEASPVANEAALSIAVTDVSGYPDVGHVTIDDEDIAYSSLDLANNVFVGARRGARDTVPASHVADTLVRNGEQLRRGTRVTPFLGYAPLPEADYGPAQGYTKLEIQSTATQNFNQVHVLRCSDLQRFAKRRIFENATVTNPVELGPGHPITLFLRVWTSTGTGHNGPYDVLPRSVGGAVPYQLIDIATFEALRIYPGIAGVQFEFRETASQDAKDWAESQILRPLGILPYVNQAGQYSGRALASPPSMNHAYVSNKIRAAS